LSIPSTITINGEKYVSVAGDAMAGAFAELHSVDQARFFNDVAAIAKLWNSYNYGEPQWCNMARDLDKNGAALLRAMALFVESPALTAASETGVGK
jgi:hypothetical protein